MLRVTVLFLFAASFAQGMYISKADNGTLKEIQELIDIVNESIAESQAEYVQLPPGLAEIFGAVLGSGNGTVGRFSSLSLRGVDQSLVQEDYDGYTVLNGNFLLGLDDLEIKYFFHSFFVEGNVEMVTNTDALRANVRITFWDDGSCQAVLEKAEMVNAGTYKISITPKSAFGILTEIIAEHLADLLGPVSLPAVNRAIDWSVKNIVPHSSFSKIVCGAYKN